MDFDDTKEVQRARLIAELATKVEHLETKRVPELIRHGTELLEQLRAAETKVRGLEATVTLQAIRIGELEGVRK